MLQTKVIFPAVNEENEVGEEAATEQLKFMSVETKQWPLVPLGSLCLYSLYLIIHTRDFRA